jgi:hypothetical protein
MTLHEEARRGQVVYGRTTTEVLATKRDTGRRTDTKDDLGRTIMPFDWFMGERAAEDRPTRLFGVRVMELAEAFGF